MSETSSDDNSNTAESVRYYWRQLSSRAYLMAHVLGLKKLQDFMQGSAALTAAPACLLGQFYGDTADGQDVRQDASMSDEDLEALLQDFKSRLWLTYRKDIPPIGDTPLTSDAGWGCTIRSGQMLLAEALVRCRLGRSFRSSELQQHPQELLELITLFQDTPSSTTPLSIHHICQQGAPHGVVVGQWLGPWVLCKALEALVNSQGVGLRLHVVCEPGGGAPCLVPSRVTALFTGRPVDVPSLSSPQQQQQQQQQQQRRHSAEEVAGFVAVERGDAAAAPEVRGSTAGAAPGGGRGTAEGGGEGTGAGLPPLLLLVPLTLGVDKANPRYLPQLKAVLTYPQSVGIVGGRPGSSLYFVGSQQDSLIHLDPHYPQPPASLPQDLPTFFCPTPRLTPLASIDPSLAIGFLCTSLGELEDLYSRLEVLELQAEGAPLLTLGSGEAPSNAHLAQLMSEGSLEFGEEAEGAAGGAAGEWELV